MSVILFLSWLLKMLESSLCKCEKRHGRWLCLLTLTFMLGILMCIYYSSTLDVPHSLTFDTEASHSHNTVSSSLGTASPHTALPSDSDYIVAYPHRYHFVLDEPSRCRQESPFVVVIVPVAPHNRAARDIIRATWAQQSTRLGPKVSHYFLLALPEHRDTTLQEQLLQESRTHRDILQSSFVDSYTNLTIKTMVMFEWLISHCPGTTYGMKADSDTFLHIPNLVNMLLNAPTHSYITGKVILDAPVLRDHNSKWYLPFSVFSQPIYPHYAMGLGYVFSLDLPQRILEASAHVKAIKIEDVYVGLCLRHLGIAITDPPNEGLFLDTLPKSTDSCFWTSIILVLLEDSDQLAGVWKTYRTQERNGC